MRGVPRIALTGVAVVLAVAGLTGCRTSPTVAAYVGDETITVQELESAVDVRLRNDSIAAFAAKDPDAFTRQVLSVLVRREVHAAALEHFDVDEVSDREALDYLTSLLGGASLEQQLTQAAGQGLARGDVIELARDRVVEAEVAEATGKSERPVESVLRARYDKDAAQYTVYQVGYITVPDQATADTVLAQLQAQPETYPALAAAFPGQNTLPQLGSYPAADIPALGQQVQATPPGTGFTTPVQSVGVVVTYVASATPAAFEQVRDQVARSVQSDAEKAGQQVVADFRDGLHITVNPRYGVLNDDLTIVVDTTGVVHILDEQAAAASNTTGG